MKAANRLPVMGATFLVCTLLARPSLPADPLFQPNEVLVSDPTLDLLDGIVDPEFDGTGRFAWIDRTGNLWIGNVDRATGLLDPPDGRAELIDTGAMTVNDLGNGPEWVMSNRGPQIIYTKFIGSTTALASAANRNGIWSTRLLAQPLDRKGPFGTLDRGDPNPAISYAGNPVPGALDGGAALFVRALNDPGTETLIPTTDAFRVAGARWVSNTRWAVFSRPMPDGSSARRQAFLYDMQQQQLEQLTDDPGSKAAVLMWQAPEYGNEYILGALVDEQYIRIYRKLDPDGDGIAHWTEVNVIDPPGLDFIWSPEPFVFQGRSYIVMVTSATDDQRSITDPTEIWLAGIDPANPFYRRLSDDRQAVRKDPEVFMTRQGPYAYILVSGDGSPDIYRLDTGLGPQGQ